MSILDEIEKNRYAMTLGPFQGCMAVRPSDLNILLRLARLAERIANLIPKCRHYGEDSGIVKEIHDILHPTPPAKGVVMWSEPDGKMCCVAEEVTLSEAIKAFPGKTALGATPAPKPPVPDFTVEGLRMLLKQETEEKVRRGLALADKDDEIARLRGALEDRAKEHLPQDCMTVEVLPSGYHITARNEYILEGFLKVRINFCGQHSPRGGK